MANDSLSPVQAVEGANEIASGGKRLSTIADYWQWAHGNLLDQLDLYAGYLVRFALGCADVGRARDFTWAPEGTDTGISIRVGARCTFKENVHQEASLNVSDFMGRGAKWIALRHRADVLVFAVAHASRWKSGPSDLLNAEAWDFYVLPYMGLFDTDWGSSILESDLARYGAKHATFATLPEIVVEVKQAS